MSAHQHTDELSINQALAWGYAQLIANKHISSDEARFEAQHLLCEVLKVNRAHILTWPENRLTQPAQSHYESLIKERKAGKPVAYILGYREFWGLKLGVTAETLIPRPDTEILVTEALKRITPKSKQLIDLGTGSGAIAIALAKENPKLIVIATDVHYPTLTVAKNNANLHQVKVSFIQCHWLEAFETLPKFDMIVSNPPYIETEDQYLQQGDLRYEPIRALASGDDGLDAIKQIIQESYPKLQSKGWLLLEHGYNQAEAVRSLLAQEGFCHIETIKDFAQHDRVSLGQK
ncbi:peptide chain release factor N(5)-glutamine methyltransferase [Thiomicrospira cyclica]|uniref:Release factor glutamine methyltransferase n=1 Tax=Thiomicrospira cyclica (strain DSM 14477 / JCM 11371 / ALM1) TaxID=717773 RepID=F6DBZ1_THICA|nr:peptide chain release factor N(5)-glutamine methyltransferase [Thiomicrospira cyclica]AEG31377.1 protein-(glutamine-N5) methyltransferase, release factor-specific [Thiomicrospira cyclica ALM1]